MSYKVTRYALLLTLELPRFDLPRITASGQNDHFFNKEITS